MTAEQLCGCAQCRRILALEREIAWKNGQIAHLTEEVQRVSHQLNTLLVPARCIPSTDPGHARPSDGAQAASAPCEGFGSPEQTKPAQPAPRPAKQALPAWVTKARP